jgi:acetyl-CoA carboxylase carboxyl transferase subunit beta
MSWFKKENAKPEKVAQINDPARKLRTEGLWLKCEGCRQIIWKKDLESNWNVCRNAARTCVWTPPRG